MCNCQQKHNGTMQADQERLDCAIECIRDIAAMRTMSKRQRIISERAITWLRAHGYPEEPGGYIPGVGFDDSAEAARRRGK